MTKEPHKLHFQPVHLSMRELVHRYTKALHIQNSEYTFTSLLMWCKEDRIRIAEQDDVLYILYVFPHLAPFMLAPLALRVEDYPGAIANCIHHLEGMGARPVFHGITEDYNKAFFEQAGFVLTEDRGNYDYVYNMEDLRTLKGKKYHGKRNHINQFLSQYAYEYVTLTPDMFDACMAIYEEWLDGKDPAEHGVLGEKEAIRVGLRHMEKLGLVGGGILMDGKLRAFSLGEQIDGEMAVIHIEKADADIPGLYPLINREFVAHAWTDMKFINREEDMGLEGLRKAKLSYYPAYLLEKFRADLPS
ncbi:MAG: phosphatidylglycerol lysyltransferase domain-containing protein [Candidatus Pelethousia sp.]|nr:phosphatidylglycerol lysyltransferase domain-containing protein [Candidatus Pelethousia sp.]